MSRMSYITTWNTEKRNVKQFVNKRFGIIHMNKEGLYTITCNYGFGFIILPFHGLNVVIVTRYLLKIY